MRCNRCVLWFWLCPYLCSRQRRWYPRTKPHGTRRNGRVGLRGNSRLFFLFVFLFIGRAKTSFCSSYCHQPGQLHEHGNISVSVWSSEQTEPANARQRDAGRSVRPTLLNSTCSFFFVVFFFFFFFFKIFLSEVVAVPFLTDTHFSGVFFSSSVWHSDFRHRKALFIVHCVYSTTVCPQERVESLH